jgi:hypothetical protein
MGALATDRLCKSQAEGERGMSKNRSKWKNRPDGKTVRRNSVSAFYTSRPVEFIDSPAFRVLSRAAHQVLARIEIELRHHAGNNNGKLIVTTIQFVEYGIERRAIPPALRELEALGIIIVTERGRGGNAEHRQPNRFLLNYLCGAVDAHELITDAWKRFKTLEEAEKLATAARLSKDPGKVSYGRRTARKNISQVRKTYPKPGTENVPENGKFSGTENVPTGPGTENVPTTDISGGGGVEAASIQRKARPALIMVHEHTALPEWSTPILTEIPYTPELRRLYRETMSEPDGWEPRPIAYLEFWWNEQNEGANGQAPLMTFGRIPRLR